MAGHKKVRTPKVKSRLRRKSAIRKRVSGTPERPRLSVFRSARHIYAQAIDDVSNKVLATASDLDKPVRDSLADKNKKERAKAIGEAIGKKLLELKVDQVVFDRNGFIYHGRVKEVAEGAREAGLKF
jgi:large subunit ribosomal protein L18